MFHYVPLHSSPAGVKYGLFDPAKTATPGTFGLIYTSKGFADKHPTAVAGFTRAALHGMEDAMADPDAAVRMSVDMINAAGNQNFTFIGTATFTAPGQLRYFQDTVNTLTILEGNVTGNAGAEFQIALAGLHNPLAGDFTL